MNQKMKRAGVSFLQEHWKQLKAHSKESGLSHSAIIRKALTGYFESNTKPKK